MISTVTAASAGIVAAFANDTSTTVAAILILLALLLVKEFTSTAACWRVGARLDRTLDIAIVTLTMGFALIVAARIAEAIK